MKAFAIAVLLMFGTAFLVGVGGCAAYVSTVNKEVRQRHGVEAQQKVCEASFDTMWKVLRDKAGVADSYKAAFKEIYPELIKGRYADNKNLLAKFVTEANPTFDTKLYESLAVSIEAERKAFLNEQKKLVDLDREHRNTLDTLPGSLVLGGRVSVPITVITSDTTADAYKTGRSDR